MPAAHQALTLTSLRHNVQLAIHAIGDRAVDEVLDILRGVAANNSGRVAERRHRVEHAQHLAGPQVLHRIVADTCSLYAVCFVRLFKAPV